MLYAFYHHPDQYVLMFLIINGISSVIALISSIPGFQYLSSPSAELTLGTALSIDAELSSLMNVYVYKLIGSLVSMLVLVPFSLSTFVMNDAPGIGPIQAIRQSFAMMKKNFFRYILLLLSFLGLEISRILFLCHRLFVGNALYADHDGCVLSGTERCPVSGIGTGGI